MLLHKDSFKVVSAAIYKSERSREHLAGVRIEPDGSGVATDGHILVKFTPSMQADPKDYPVLEGVNAEGNESPLEPFTLPSEAAVEILRAIPKGRYPAVLNDYVVLDLPKTNGNGVATVGLTDLQTPKVFKPRKVEGEFPSYQEIFDGLYKKDVVAEFGLSLDVVLKLVKTFKDLEVRTFKVKVRGAEQALEIEAMNGNGKIKAMLMPCRV